MGTQLRYLWCRSTCLLRYLMENNPVSDSHSSNQCSNTCVESKEHAESSQPWEPPVKGSPTPSPRQLADNRQTSPKPSPRQPTVGIPVAREPSRYQSECWIYYTVLMTVSAAGVLIAMAIVHKRPKMFVAVTAIIPTVIAFIIVHFLKKN